MYYYRSAPLFADALGHRKIEQAVKDEQQRGC
jgi:hypothetical protein